MREITSDTVKNSSYVSSQLAFEPVFTRANGTWTATPEPTSAMLMLLGMAGLALKRKRA